MVKIDTLQALVLIEHVLLVFERSGQLNLVNQTQICCSCNKKFETLHCLGARQA